MEILLRLPPEPSSLPRASAVCKCWQCAVTDPRFHSRFCQHHRKPPILGFFMEGVDGIVFKPVLDPPNRIPGRRFQLRLHSICRVSGSAARLLGCRHGRVLITDWLFKVLIVIAPITGTGVVAFILVSCNLPDLLQDSHEWIHSQNEKHRRTKGRCNC
uniref:F-box domain-containing protein n=1 Tax=Aegilops tauschii TaxID=37682 RepID=M8CGU0_AEGTA